MGFQAKFALFFFLGLFWQVDFLNGFRGFLVKYKRVNEAKGVNFHFFFDGDNNYVVCNEWE